MNKFVKTFQKLTALFITIFAMPKETLADKVGEWYQDGCNTGIYSACVRFPGNTSTYYYPNHNIETKRYNFPRDNPTSQKNPIDMGALIRDLGGTQNIRTDTYKLYRRAGTGGNGCFQVTARFDNSLFTIRDYQGKKAFQLNTFPYLGFVFRVKADLSGFGAKIQGNNHLNGRFYDVKGYDISFPTGCMFTGELGIQPVLEVTPVDLTPYVPSTFDFSTGNINLNLEHSFVGAFSIEGRDTSGHTPRVTSDGGSSINGKNVTIRLSAVTCIIDGQANQVRDFGTKKSSGITAPITANDVDIRVNCGANTYIEPWIVFTDNNDNKNVSSTLKMVYTDDRAKIANVGVKLKQKNNGKYISFGPDSSKKGTQNQIQLTKEFAQQNYYIISFTPELIKLDNSKKIEGGELEGLATYTLSYQ
ncbi:fimbrial protein [Haemophilus influenzae biotype aegyptius]|uniref:fimbrial protein n=1 Tax=Haemophilus influenzae TaxID=727 RepID=UPI0001F3656F|nr:fimbrial protein [Haemophilus influenzae]QEQ61563.1 fimbrial protein [Haemophilus influenzae biotype aegyptius]QEQ62938.1 fimbrial protein [Haemophilus influenzae biotype aegyptius]QEQ65122.1 fimbrial protein [Haemophilus influenzae biotype aegyptius]TMQ35911.1 fimbrial protein [Haemophilus influenzae biotype aegyptius]TMQ36070.1 fimbrial protein [Haemophilus influenzae biotype aegyptius]